MQGCGTLQGTCGYASVSRYTSFPLPVALHLKLTLLHNYTILVLCMPVPVAARSKAQVYGRSPADIVGSNPTGGMDVCLL